MSSPSPAPSRSSPLSHSPRRNPPTRWRTHPPTNASSSLPRLSLSPAPLLPASTTTTYGARSRLKPVSSGGAEHTTEPWV
uniref:Uncharacterized protein n=1 Tax=Triticum urartu TaxID=4572 RepID=A0A8R7PD45_TRIUA